MFSLFKFQHSRWFWIIRYFLNRISFFTGKHFFQLKDKIEQIKESYSISKELFKVAIPSLTFAFFTIILLTLSEKLLLSINIQNPFFIKGLIDFLKRLNLQLMQSSTSLETLLSVTASVSGVFLGLYFTAISVIASSVYARVPSDIRALLLKEKVGNFYIRVLIVLTSISLILLGYKSLGGNPGVLNLITITLLGCFGVISFGVLGIRAFFFFDPTRLSNTIFHDLSRNVRSATINGFRWSDPSFQFHYHKQAFNNIQTLDVLIKICSQERYLRGEPLSFILEKLIFFLKKYATQRSIIPSNSRWYSYVPRYKDWFFTDSSSIEIAVQSRTQIQPEMIPDHFWLEDKTIEILLDGLNEVINGDFEKACGVLTILNMYFEILGTNLELKKGKEIIDKITNIIDTYFKNWQFNINKNNNEVALYEGYLLMTMSLIIGFNNFLRESKSADLINKIDSINWENPKEVYKDLPPLLLERLEFIQSRLNFEWKVEGNFISPNWYIRQLVAARYLELIKEALEETLLLLDKLFVDKSEHLLSQEKFILVAFHSNRALELINKIEAHIPHLKKLVEELNAIRKEKDLTWVNWDWKDIDTKISQAKDKLVVSLAKCLLALSLIEHKENFPDLFGQTYSFICEDLYESMQIKNKKTFKNLFPLLFIASFSAYEKLRIKITDLQQQNANLIVFEPLIDIMELSGYTEIYSELNDIPEIWNECKKIWDLYFKENNDLKSVLKFLVKIYQYKQKSLVWITPRDIIRTKWKMSLNKKLEELGLIYGLFSSRTSWDADMTVKHKSPFIRALCRGRYEPHISAPEIFIITYLLKRPESDDIEFKDLYDLEKAIKKEESNNKEEQIIT